MPPKVAIDPQLVTIEPGKKATIVLADFLDMQEKLANAMSTYRGIAMKILEASSNQLSITTDALTNLHSYTLSTLAQADVKPDQISLALYPTIGQLLKSPREKIKDYDSLKLPHQGIGDKQKRSSKPKKQKDPDAPKRPETAYLRFANAEKESYRQKMRKDNPNVSNGEVAKQLTADWHALGEAGQKKWKDLYQEELQEYNRKKAEYEKRTGKKVEDKPDEEQDVVTAGNAAAMLGKSQASIEEGIAQALSPPTDDEDSSGSSSEDDSSPSPPPAPKAKNTTPKANKAKGGKAADDSPKKGKDDGKKKRKLDENEDDAGKKKTKKNKKDDSDDDSKKKKPMSNIDPRLEKMEKDKKRQKRKNAHGDDY